MKRWLAASLVALAVAPGSTVRAAECTDAQLAELNGSAEDLTEACKRAIASSSITAVDLSSLAGINLCSDPTCLAYLKQLSPSAPKCEFQGLSVEAVFEVIFSVCDLLPLVTTTKPTATTKPKPTTKTPPTPEPDVSELLPSLNESVSGSESETVAPMTTRPTVPSPLPILASSKPPPSSDAATIRSGAAIAVVLATLLAVS